MTRADERSGWPPLTELRAVCLGIEGVLCPSRWSLLKQALLSALAAQGHAVGGRALERAVAGLERAPRRRGKALARYGPEWVRTLLHRVGLPDAEQPDLSALPPALRREDLYADVEPFLDALRSLAITRVVVAFPGDPPPHEVTRALGIGEQFEVLVAAEDDGGDGWSLRGVLLTAMEVCRVRPEQTALVAAHPAALAEAAACHMHTARLDRDRIESDGVWRTLDALHARQRALAESGLV